MEGLKKRRLTGETGSSSSCYGGNDGEDTLSNLPDDVLIHIMCFLDTKFAVQTSTLSKSWANLWTLLPDLNLHSDSFKNYSSFEKFVNEVLDRRSSLVRFNNFNFSSILESLPVEKFLRKVTTYAVEHGVSNFSLLLERHIDLSFLDCFCTCDSLKSLKLKTRLRHFLEFPIDVPFCLSHLTTLYLEEVDLFQPDAFSGCASLVNLTLIDCRLQITDLDSPQLKFDAPQLSNLTIVRPYVMEDQNLYITIRLSTPRLTSFKFQGDYILSIRTDHELSLLSNFFMDCCDSLESFKLHSEKLLSTLDCLRYAKSITLSTAVIQLLADCPEKLAQGPSPFCNLRLLRLTRSESPQHKTASSLKIPDHVIVYLLKSSPHAEVITEIPWCRQ